MYAIINNKLVACNPLNCRGLHVKNSRPTGYIITKEDLLFMVHNPRCVSTMLEALTPRTVSWDVTTLLNPAHKDISKEEFEAKYLNYWEPESDDSTR